MGMYHGISRNIFYLFENYFKHYPYFYDPRAEHVFIKIELNIKNQLNFGVIF